MSVCKLFRLLGFIYKQMGALYQQKIKRIKRDVENINNEREEAGVQTMNDEKKRIWERISKEEK